MRKITLFNFALIIVIFLGIIPNSDAQLQNTNWYFGNQAGLNFNDGTQTPTVLTNNVMVTNGGSASVSDASGNLLFYTNGVNVWNNTHQIMPNGEDLFGNTDISQSVVIIPNPADATKYYVITNRGNVMGLSGLYYSTIDMTADGGLGDVDTNERNVLLSENTGERLTTIQNPNDNTFWLVSFGPGANPIVNDTFYSYKIDLTGINLVSQSTFTFALPQSSSNSGGQMKISPDGQSLALVHNTVSTDGVLGILEAETLFSFDFDDNTGLVSNLNSEFSLDADVLYSYGLEFSPDSNLLYLSITDKRTIGPPFPDVAETIGRIYQLDYRSMGSPVLIYQGLESLYGLQLGIDGKIYVANTTSLIGTIDDPNTIGIGANYTHDNIDLGMSASAQEFPQLVPIVAAPKSLLKIFNTAFANDTIIRLEAKDTGLVVFGEIGADNEDNLPGQSPGFIAEYTDTGTLVTSEIQQLPYQNELDLNENSFKWEDLPTSLSLSGEVNQNYKLSKFNNENQLEFEIVTTNINEDLIEDKFNSQTLLVFPTTTTQDFSIMGSTGRTWSKTATQIFVQDSTLFTKTYNLARFDLSGALINVVELLNYKWSRNSSGGTVLVDFPTKIVGETATIYFTTGSRDEDIFTEATKINLTNGEFHKKGEWLMFYDIRNNLFKQAKLVGQVGSTTPNELIFNQSTLFRKRKKNLYKLDQDLNEIDSLSISKLEILDTNEIDGTFIIRGDNKRTIKKVDSDFNEIWSKNLGKKFTITHASEAPNGEVYVSGSYTENATLTNPDNIDLPHNSGTDVFIAKVDGLPISGPIMMDASTTSEGQGPFESSKVPSIGRELVIYPNPFEDYISIRLNKGNNYGIEIYNSAGKLIAKRVYNAEKNNDFKVNTANLKKGLYHIIITEANSKRTYKKIVKI